MSLTVMILLDCSPHGLGEQGTGLRFVLVSGPRGWSTALDVVMAYMVCPHVRAHGVAIAHSTLPLSLFAQGPFDAKEEIAHRNLAREASGQLAAGAQVWRWPHQASDGHDWRMVTGYFQSS